MHESALTPAPAPIDARLFRDTLGHYASGITVISGLEGGEPVGFTCQSFYSVSIDPPLVSFSVMLTSTTYPRIKQSGRFAVNVLAHDQHHVSNQFARKGTDKTLGVGQRAGSKAPGPIGRLLSKSVGTSRKAANKSHEKGKEARSKSPL